MSDTTSVIVSSTLNAIYNKYPDFVPILKRTDIETIMNEALVSTLPKDFTLQSSKPDFEAIYLQLVQELETDPVWKDLIPAGTGMTLLRNTSAATAMLHNAIVRATQIVFLQPGTPKSSVYATMKSFGVNPRRRLPAKLAARITVPDHQGSFIIPRFTQFTIQSEHYINREDIVYSEFELYKDVGLVQGTKFTQTGVAAGNVYETLEIGYENYAISDEDVYVFINGEKWSKAATAVWNMPKRSKQYFVSTQDSGNVEIRFGNDAYGKKLQTGDDIELVWFETLGKSASNVPTGTTFSSILDNGVVDGVTLSPIYGMDDELSTEFYINAGPFLRSSEHGAVTRGQYPDVACRYPGVRDALFRFQAELNPGKRNWMNIAECTVLTTEGGTISAADWPRFVTFLKENGISHLEYIQRDPFIIPVDITANVFCSNSSILDTIKATLTSEILAMSSPRRGSIGYSIYGSDAISILEGKITKTKSPIKNIGNLIEYVTDYSVSYSTGFDASSLPGSSGIDGSDVIADFYSYVKIQSVKINTYYTTRRSNSGRRDLNIGTTNEN